MRVKKVVLKALVAVIPTTQRPLTWAEKVEIGAREQDQVHHWQLDGVLAH